jgi:hypothetical protein
VAAWIRRYAMTKEPLRKIQRALRRPASAP